MPIAAIVNGNTYAVHADHLNTPRHLTDDQGRPAWQWKYSAFGDEAPTKGAKRFVDPEAMPGYGNGVVADVSFNLRYPGQYADAESGLFYNYFRSYSPSTGRYSQPDPIGLQGDWNRFAYVEGNPLMFTDPLGLQASPGSAPHRPMVPNLNPRVPLPPGTPSPAANQAAGAAKDFMWNYSDMRSANTIGADKYFHCKANCEASSRGSVGDRTACLLSDAREWVDQNMKGDPASASALDQAANTFGRSHADRRGSCDVICGIYRPTGLPSRY